MRFHVEVTDTFAGEANYSWVNHYTFKAPADAKTPLLVRRAKQVAGLSGRHRTEDYGDSITVRPYGDCIVMFIEAGKRDTNE